MSASGFNARHCKSPVGRLAQTRRKTVLKEFYRLRKFFLYKNLRDENRRYTKSSPNAASSRRKNYRLRRQVLLRIFPYSPRRSRTCLPAFLRPKSKKYPIPVPNPGRAATCDVVSIINLRSCYIYQLTDLFEDSLNFIGTLPCFKRNWFRTDLREMARSCSNLQQVDRLCKYDGSSTIKVF